MSHILRVISIVIISKDIIRIVVQNNSCRKKFYSTGPRPSTDSQPSWIQQFQNGF
jgi:hypothetical protein